MATDLRHAGSYIQRLLKDHSPKELARRLESKPGATAKRIPGGTLVTEAAIAERWALLNSVGRSAIADPQSPPTTIPANTPSR